MGRVKGFRLSKKAAEEFTNFTPPKVSDKIKAPPKLKALHNQMSQPPSPLKYKPQELPSPDYTWNTPLGNTSHIPFQVQRTHLGNLPVYSDYKKHRTLNLTIVRRVSGDVDEFKEELAKVVSNAPIEEKIGRVEIKGIHTEIVKLWLRKLGF